MIMNEERGWPIMYRLAVWLDAYGHMLTVTVTMAERIADDACP